MPTLIPMTQPEYEAFVERAIPEYAADNVRAGYWSESEALEKSREGYEKLLPNGLQTENQFLYTLYDASQAVGMIWIRADLQSPVKNGFIFELHVDEKFRGKGYGKQAMLLIEEKARELGLKSLGLHVFAVNNIARNSYESVGYEVSSLNMAKKL
ncbi:MAG TPA: GNAT family N-acetyltransferase [Anaerolineales bacterium]|nr:GNAT family N-acetyltransferase [Anaerolineales bacterium]